MRIEKNENAGLSEIKIVSDNASDCRALGQNREYSLQISSDASGEKFVILNPIQPLFKQ